MAEEDRFRWLKEEVVKEKKEREIPTELRLKSTSGKTYILKIDDSSGTPQLKIEEIYKWETKER